MQAGGNATVKKMGWRGAGEAKARRRGEASCTQVGISPCSGGNQEGHRKEGDGVGLWIW